MTARELKQQDFLDYCFKNLILKAPALNQGKYSLVKTGDLNDILKKLESSDGMSVEALWMFACAYICNQESVCNEFLKRNWQKTWIRLGAG